MSQLTQKKFLLEIRVDSGGIIYDITSDQGQETDFKAWFIDNLPIMPTDRDELGRLLTDKFFKDVETLLGKRNIESIAEMNHSLAEHILASGDSNNTTALDDNFTLLVFAAYLMCFPADRIDKYSSKASHARLNIERQLEKYYTIIDLKTDKTSKTIRYEEIRSFVRHISKA